MEKHPFVSVIIPTARQTGELRKCIESLLSQDYPKDKFEIILVSKNPVRQELLLITDNPKIAVITGIEFEDARNAGALKARGEFLAFVDDDCLIPKNWIGDSVRYLTENNVAVVGGPILPLQHDTFHYRMGGYLFSSPFAVGFASARYRRLAKLRETGERNLLTANTVIRKKAFDAVGGFDSKQVRSEDSDLYFRLSQKGYRLLYVPDIFVWHRSKPTFWPIIKKVFYYAVGRAQLMARKPETMKPMYFIPSLGAAGFIAFSFVSFFVDIVFYFFLAAVFLYLILNIAHAFYIFVKRERSIRGMLVVFLATPLIHFSYGFGILFGMYEHFAKKEVEAWGKGY